MTDQPEALRLADLIDSDFDPDWMHEQGYDQIAAELRRLHSEVEALTGIHRKYLRILQQDNIEIRTAARSALDHLDRLIEFSSSEGPDIKAARHAANALREALGENNE